MNAGCKPISFKLKHSQCRDHASIPKLCHHFIQCFLVGRCAMSVSSSCMPLDVSMALQGSSPDKKPPKKSRTRTLQLPARTTRHSHASQVGLLQSPDLPMSLDSSMACAVEGSMIKLLLSCSQAHFSLKGVLHAAVNIITLLLPRLLTAHSCCLL